MKATARVGVDVQHPSRYSGLKRMLDERRREIHAEVQGKMRNVRAEGTWGGKLNEVLDAVESSEADIQDEIEEGWETGEFQKIITPDEAKVRTCDREGCNHSRYPASNARGCIFHSRGHDSFAANYRRARARER